MTGKGKPRTHVPDPAWPLFALGDRVRILSGAGKDECGVIVSKADNRYGIRSDKKTSAGNPQYRNPFHDAVEKE